MVFDAGYLQLLFKPVHKNVVSQNIFPAVVLMKTAGLGVINQIVFE